SQTQSLTYLSSFLYYDRPHRDLHSFPTRRSSDLEDPGWGPRWAAHPSRGPGRRRRSLSADQSEARSALHPRRRRSPNGAPGRVRSEEHTSELQSRGHLVCRLLLEKKKTHGISV